MSVNKTDISQQIKKYLNGELNAKEMHALEKEAQNDPFLMDALEGYDIIGADQEANLEEIKDLFNERVNPTERRSLVLWRILPIAASVLIALSIGLIWFLPRNDEPKAPIAQTLHKIENDKPVVDKQQQPASQANTQIVKEIQTETAPVKENPAATQRIASHQHKTKLNANGATAGHAETTDQPAQTIAQVLANRAQSLEIQNTAPAVPVKPVDKKISGIITDPTGHALSGVKIAVKGTPLTAVTDANGAFTITELPAQGTLSIAYAGYETRQVPLNNTDSIKVVLKESATELATVSVPGYVDDDKPSHQSHPLMGWKAFRDYLRKNAVMPDGETGRVKLAFKVSADGSIKGIRVIRGKSDAMNQKAMELVLNGPEWKGMDESKELKLKIRFRRAKSV
ncbi:energy transducer TonB family protein [Mucilaginibacter paludis]|uniref:TonB family protein n=1 Tax=Mucilaginibacter paludis DSM 18603 TaxID=714943 RepID=H1Y4H8_9SPHI|nr:energy transducer TonB [Mucilaginibacter paludis]EHQ26762.1 TonB family protein [Mucilaginibacter paludis DSM 18603]